MTKTCTACGVDKALDEFYAHPSGLYGKTNHCKPCKRAYDKARYEQNKAARLQQMKEWREANPTKVVELRYQYAESQGRRYTPRATKTPEQRDAERRAYAARYRAENREVFNARIAKWKRENRDKVRDYSMRRRATLLGAEGDHSHEDWLRVLRIWNHACAYCDNGDRLTKDHVVPLSRGGSNHIGNIVPACLSCNSSKCNKLLIEWKNSRPGIR